MSLLGPRPSSISRDEPSRRGVACEAPRATESLAFEVRWTWSRRAASRTLGFDCRRDLKLLVSVEIRISGPSAAGLASAEGSGRWQLLGGGEAIELPDAVRAMESTLRGTVLDTANFRHLDLVDDRGVFLRTSLPCDHAVAPPVWSRIPNDLGIAGGCLSAPSLSVVGDGDASLGQLPRSIAATGEGSLRSASR